MAPPVIRLGVDFGTSNTVAVVRWPDGRGRTLLFDGSPLLPSAVYAEPSGALVIGRDAVHSARLEPARFEPNPKRRIDDGSVLLGDREVSIVQLMSSVLERVGEEYRRTVGAPPTDTTLTCPASWGATRRFVLSDAAAAAGFGNIRLVAEPVAAATYLTQGLGREVPIGSAVGVDDFGAGPFDEQTIRVTQGVIRWASLAEGRLAGVFLVGGSSRIPLVVTLLHTALGTPPVAIEQPETVVAEGSMLAGAAALPASAGAAPG